VIFAYQDPFLFDLYRLFGGWQQMPKR
jgi:hypothetical protein